MELKASPNGCEEASVLSKDHYIPCNKPAVQLVFHERDDRTYRMCEACAWHNIQNRGGQDRGPFEAVPVTQEELLEEAAAVLDALPPVEAEPDPAVLDYSEFEEGPQGDDQERLATLNSLSKAVLELPGLERAVAEAEEALKRAQDALADRAEKLIPELMEKLDLTVYPLRDGGKVIIKESVRASIPKPAEAQAFAWFRREGHGGLIKRELKASFGMGEDDEAAAALAALKEIGVSAEDKQSIHASTLAAWVRERLEEGKTIPEMVGVFRQRVAKISVK